MNQDPVSSKTIKQRIQSLVPIFILIFIIFFFGVLINSKKEKVAAEKRGLNVIKGELIAAENAGKVAEIVVSAKNVNDAVKDLTRKLNLSKNQAQAVMHMPVSKFTVSAREKRKAEIAYIEEKLEENKDAEITEETFVNVVTMVLEKRPVQDRINLPGNVEPWVRLDISAEVRGVITEKRVVPGTEIKKGEVIARIDIRDYQNTLTAAKASYETALAAKNRIQKLIREKLATRAQFDEAVAGVENAKAQMDIAKLALERCTITSPVSGFVNKLPVESGEYINVSQVVAEVIQTDKVKVVLGIPESDVDDVRKANDFNVRIEALGGQTFSAEKYFLSRTTDPLAKLYTLELVLGNPDRIILPDMFCRVEIVKKRVPEAVVIPFYSVISRNGDHVVYVIQKDVVEARVVELGIMDGFHVEVKKGLAPGEHVVVVGQRNVTRGQKVNVIRTVTRLEDLSG